MKARFSDTALIELEEIFTYIAADNPNAAAEVIRRIKHVVTTIGEFPEIGHEADEPNSRMLSVGRYPYLIFYTVAADEVVVIHVRHAARQRP
jgi:toxin ParE1/3/4